LTLAAIGVPNLHPHLLRHTAASLAIASGADVKVVQQMLGHASATMTLDTYGHLFDDRLDEVGEAMDAACAAARERRIRGHAAVDEAKRGQTAQMPETRKRSLPAFPLVRTASRCCTPDRIRTGATAVRGRRARPLHNGGLAQQRETLASTRFSHQIAATQNGVTAISLGYKDSNLD
jgi:hypothetical protein